MRNVLILFIVFMLQSQLGRTQQWLSFADTAAGLTLKFPPDWEQKTDANGRIFFTSPLSEQSDDFRDNINIGYKYNEAYVSMKILAPAFEALPLQLQKNFDEYKVEKEGYFKVNGIDAYEIIYTGKMKDKLNQSLRFIQWFVVHDLKLYTITFTAEADNKLMTPTALNIMRGITFKH